MGLSAWGSSEMLIVLYHTHKQSNEGMRLKNKINFKKKKTKMMSKNLTDVLLSCTFELWLHFAHVLMAASTIQFHLVLWPLSGQKVKWLPHEKNRNYPLNPLQDSFKAAVISFYPTTKCFYSSLRHVDADWVWRHQLSAEEEDLWGAASLPRSSFFTTWLRRMGPEYYRGTWALRWCWSTQNVNPTSGFHTRKQHPLTTHARANATR